MRIRIIRQCVVQGTPALAGSELDLDDKTATILVQMRRADPVDGSAPKQEAPQEVIEEATQQRRTRKSE